MENKVKMTKKERFEALLGFADVAADADMVAFINSEIELLNKKTEKAKERAAERKEQSDELTKVVFAALTEEPQTVNEILKVLNDDSLTPQKVISRLSKLAKAGVVNKEDVKVDGRTVKGYSVVAANSEE